MYFYTYHGTFLCVDASGGVIQETIENIEDISDVLDIPCLGPGADSGYCETMCQSSTVESIVIESEPLKGALLTLSNAGRMATISVDALFLCAMPEQSDVVPARREASLWETFVCLSKTDMLDLLFLRENEWILGGRREVLPRHSVMGGAKDYMLCIGPIAVDLRYNIPLNADTRSGRLDNLFSATLLIDGWKVERIYLFKPLIFITAFAAEEYLEQARLCVQSLLEFGHYRGRFHIISDRPHEFFSSRHPDIAPQRLTVQQIAAGDWVGYVASKYCILELEEIDEFQPLLFLDPDVMADSDVNDALADIARSQRIMAPLEEFSSLTGHPSVGSTLLQRAGTSPRFACGFNGGTLGIPNVKTHRNSLLLIRTIIQNHLKIFGRNSFQWVDQEVANYVSYAHSNFDTSTLLRYVRYGWQYCENNADHRIGFVHFFPNRGSMSKSEAMRIYTATLRKHDAERAMLSSGKS